MNRADIDFIALLIKTLPADAETRAMVADAFAYPIHERHPKMLPDYMSWKGQVWRRHGE